MDLSYVDLKKGGRGRFLDNPPLENCLAVNANPTSLDHFIRLYNWSMVNIFLLIIGQGSRPLLPLAKGIG
jgi:hypothetical protein